MRKRISRMLARVGAYRLALRVRGIPVIAGAQDPPPDKTFTQAEHEAEVNRIVQERLARDRKDRLSDEEIADLRKKAEKADELEAANLSKADQLQRDTEKAQQERDEAKQAATEATDRANKTLIRAQIIAAAAKAGAVDPDDVHALLANKNFTVQKDGADITVAIGDDGQVTGHEEAVTAFLEGKQHLVGTTPTPGPGGGGPRPGTTPALTKDELAMANSFGMTPEEYAEHK